MITSPPKLESSIRAHFKPRLKEDGFTGSGRTFRRLRGRLILVVNIQGSHYGGQFAINLGLQPLGLPDVLGRMPDQKKITEPDCEFRRRLSEDGADQWWTHDSTAEGMDAAVMLASDVYQRIGKPLLESLSGPDSPIFTLSPAQMPAFRETLRGFGSTDCRIALVLARMRMEDGRTDEAREFASYGLEHVGLAVSLRSQLKAIFDSK